MKSSFRSLITIAFCVVPVNSFTNVPTSGDRLFIQPGSVTALSMFHSQTKGSSHVLNIESYVDWLELHDDEEFDQKKITAVTFHASWCKFCQKFKLKWNRKMVRPYQDAVNFASAEFGANKKLCQSLSINKLPTVQFYHNGKLLSSFPCGPKGFSTVQKTMTKYLEMDSSELARETQRWEEQESKNPIPRTSGTAIPVAMEEKSSGQDEENDNGRRTYEPDLYLRKRDRLKKKLSRRKNKQETT